MSEFCPCDCPYLNITEKQQSDIRLQTRIDTKHKCLRYNVILYHMLAHPNIYRCEQCYQDSIQKVQKEFNCPECGKTLELINLRKEQDKLLVLYHCEYCFNNIDKDWLVTYTKENTIEKIERHFWG